MIYTIANTKGGVGKTTIAVHFAYLSSLEKDTLLIDGDNQNSSAIWAAWRRDNGFKPAPVTARLYGPAIKDEGLELSKKYKNTFIDTGGRDTQSLRCSLLITDVLIIPIGASNFDAAGLNDILDLIQLVRPFNEKLIALVLMTRVDKQTKDTVEMLSYLKENDIKVLKTMICERVEYRRATGNGSTVLETNKDKKAIIEIKQAYSEVINDHIR